jgi:hypothetical protein
MPYKRDWRESTESAAKKGDSEAIAEMKEQAAKERKKLEEKDRFGAKASAYGADIIETLAKPAGRDTSNINKLKGEINMLKSNVKKYEDQGYAKGGDVQSESSKLDQKNAAMDKAQEEGRKRYEKEEIESNQAPRKAVSDAVDYVKGKAKQLGEFVGKEARNYGRTYKRGLGMEPDTPYEKKKGGVIKSSASSRGDGIATKGKTRGRIV